MEETQKWKETIVQEEFPTEPQTENLKRSETNSQEDPQTKETIGGINTPHDKGYKKSLSRPAEFQLPAMVPIVFYNGQDRWTAARSLKDYQHSGDVFGKYILNLEYYLVDLSELQEEYILSTNTVLDNIMYCDRYRKKLELVGAIRTAYGRIKELGLQEREEFRNWVKYILLSVCDMKEAVAEEILSWAGNGEDKMAFKYNIVRVFEEEREKERAEGRAEGKVEGKAEDILDLLEDINTVPDELRERIMAQKDLDILRKWHRLAARVDAVEEFERQISGDT